MKKYTAFKWQPFCLLQIIACLILGSWLLPATRTLWDAMDAHVFFTLNGWVAHAYFWQVFWAAWNWRPFDLIPFVIFGASICVANLAFPKKDIKSLAILMVTLLIFMMLVRLALHHLVSVNRASASLVLKPAYRLNTLVPWIAARDHSHTSFPGDHAAVIFAWLGFVLIYSRNYWRGIAIVLATFFTLPRIVAGAHWFSDDMVGGIFIALVSIAWVCYTPLGQFAITKLLPLFNKALNKLCPAWLLKLTFEQGSK